MTSAAVRPEEDLGILGLRQVREWALTHLAWLTAAAGVVLGLVKIMRVARLDVTTALGLVNAGGPVAVSVGALATALPGLAGAGMVLGATVSYLRAVNHRPDGGAPLLLAAAVMVAAQVEPATSFAGYGLASFAIVLTVARVRSVAVRRAASVAVREPRALPATPTRFFMILVGLALIAISGSLVVDDSPWLPPELLSAGGPAITGYVVGVHDGWTTILRADDRRLIVVRSTALSIRRPCRLGGRSHPPVAAFLNRSLQPRYRRCPK